MNHMPRLSGKSLHHTLLKLYPPCRSACVCVSTLHKVVIKCLDWFDVSLSRRWVSCTWAPRVVCAPLCHLTSSPQRKELTTWCCRRGTRSVSSWGAGSSFNTQTHAQEHWTLLMVCIIIEFSWPPGWSTPFSCTPVPERWIALSLSWGTDLLVFTQRWKFAVPRPRLDGGNSLIAIKSRSGSPVTFLLSCNQSGRELMHPGHMLFISLTHTHTYMHIQGHCRVRSDVDTLFCFLYLVSLSFKLPVLHPISSHMHKSSHSHTPTRLQAISGHDFSPPRPVLEQNDLEI